MNLFMLLMELVKPIKVEKANTMLDNTVLAHEKEAERLLGSLVSEKGNTMGDADVPMCASKCADCHFFGTTSRKKRQNTVKIANKIFFL